MKTDLEYFERQRFNRWLAGVLFLLTNGSFYYVGVSQYFINKTWGNHPTDDTIYLISTILLTLVTVGFFFVRLDTLIDKEGIYYRMFPFHPKFKFLPWERISEAEVKKMNPIKEMGGWGMRIRGVNFGGYGMRFGIRSKSYTVSGNRVLLLKLDNNKKIYIGTRKPDELSEFLVKLNAERKQK